MRLTFRQGLVAAPAPTSFLTVNGSNGIDLVVGQIPVVATAAFSTSDYLIGEYASVVNAWGPFPIGPVTQYLYWQINEATGAIVRGSTTLTPVISGVAPASPAVGQIWWNTNLNQMNIWNGSVWNTTILVFAAQLTNGAILQYFENIGPGFSQVGLNGLHVDAGFVLTDGFGGVFRDQAGALLTTETNLISNDTGSQVKLDNALLVVTTYNLPIPAFTLVYLNNGLATPASSDPVNFQVQAPIAMITEATPGNTAAALSTAGKIVINTAWEGTLITSPAQFGLPVYCDNFGNITFVKPSSSKYVRVGTVLNNNSILLSFDWETDLSSAAIGSGVQEVLSTSPIMITGSAQFPVVNIQPVTISQPGFLSSTDFTTFLNYGPLIATKVNSSFSGWTIAQVVGLQSTLNGKINVVGGVIGNLPAFAASGQLADSGIAASTINAKVDKVPLATSGDFAAFMSGGNIVDSGFNASSFAGATTTANSIATLTSDINTINITLSSKANFVAGGMAGDFVSLQSDGDIADSGFSSSSFAGASATATALANINSSIVSINSSLNTKVDKPGSVTAGNFASFVAGGDIIDSGFNNGSFIAINSTSIQQSQIVGLALALSSKVNKSGDTMTGALTVPSFNVGSVFSIQPSGEIDLSGTAGSTGQVLTSNGTGNPASWATISSVSNLSGGSAGSVPYQTFTSTTAQLPIGTTGQVLTVVSGLPAWASPAAGPTPANLLTGTTLAANVVNSSLTTLGALTSLTVTGAASASMFSGSGAGLTGIAPSLIVGGLAGGAAGSLPFQSASNTTMMLGIGTAGQVLTVAGGVPTWSNPGAAGVSSVTGTVNQITVSPTSGNVVVSLPSSVTISGTSTAGMFFGDGSNLTSINGANIQAASVPNSALVNSSVVVDVDGAGAGSVSLGGTLTLFGSAIQGITTSIAAGSQVTISAVDATTSQKGVSSFNASQFTVTAGAVSLNTGPAAPHVTAQTGTTYTAVAFDYIIADTTANPLTVTLPASPTIGQVVWFVDGAGTWATNNLTVAPNGSDKINGTVGSLIANQNRENFSLVYYNVAQGWIIGV